MTDQPPEEATRLWADDSGTLLEGSRRALLEILKGPYLSGRQSPSLWASLIADESAVRSRLHDLFLDLVIDRVDEYAFARKVRTTEREIPSALRSERLAFIDTAMLLVLRQFLLAAHGERRVIVGQDEVFERLAVYRDRSTDESTFERNLNAAWGRMMNRHRVIHSAGDTSAEISPVVKFIVDEAQIAALSAEYTRIAREGAPVAVSEDEG